MSETPTAGWDAWLARWERFQSAYAPERQSQFDVMCRYAADRVGGGTLRALDLCAGPGSLGARLIAHVPGARVIAVDVDPLLMEIGRRGRGAESIAWVRADLRHVGWSAALPAAPYDAALCATALHWFDDDQVRAIYRETAGLLRRGGALLVSDTMPHGTLGAQAATRAMRERDEARQTAGGEGESWVSFWRAAEAEPAFAPLLAERARVLGLRGPRVAPSLEFHVGALIDAGFTDVGEVWRRDAWAILLAIR